MRVEAVETMRAPRLAYRARTTWLWLCLLSPLSVLATAPTESLCEYRNLEVDEQTGDVRFIPPVRTGPEDCSDNGAAQVELDPGWRQKLPGQVRWSQRSDALSLCQIKQSPWGQRMLQLPQQGCVFLQVQQACTIVTTQALSHAQLANAVRSCVP